MTSSPLLEINPYITGAGRYPKRLLTRVATLFAVVRLLSSTEFSMMPVNVGTIKAPIKSSSQVKVRVRYYEVENGMGRAVNIPIIHIMSIAVKDFGSLYPPKLLMVTPPTKTPINGAVIQVNE